MRLAGWVLGCRTSVLSIESVVTVLCAWITEITGYNHVIIFVGTKSRIFTTLSTLVSCGSCAVGRLVRLCDRMRTDTGAGARERNDPTIRRMCTPVKRTVQPSMFETKMCFVRRIHDPKNSVPPTSEEAFASQKSNPKRDRHASLKARRTRHTGTASATRPSVEYSYMHFPSLSDRH